VRIRDVWNQLAERRVIRTLCLALTLAIPTSFLTVTVSGSSASAHTRSAVAITTVPSVEAISADATANWVITVTNVGPVPLKNVSVADPVAHTCSTHFAGTLAPGMSETTYRCSRPDSKAGFTQTATAHATGTGGSGPASASSVATVEIVGLNVGYSCLTPVFIGQSLACQYFLSVPIGYDTVTFDNIISEIFGYDGAFISGNLLPEAIVDLKGGASCTPTMSSCTLPGGSSLSVEPISFYDVEPDDYLLTNHFLDSDWSLNWTALCDDDTAQCQGLNQVEFVTTVEQYSPSVSTELSPQGPVSVGTAVTDQATLDGASPNAGGSVSYAVYSNSSCTTLVANLGTETVVNGVVGPSIPWTASDGSFWFQAVYSGDPSDAPVGSPCLSEPLTVGDAVVHSSRTVRERETVTG
jgi:hypothetical protein